MLSEWWPWWENMCAIPVRISEKSRVLWKSARAAYSKTFWQLLSASKEHGFTQHEQLRHNQKQDEKSVLSVPKFISALKPRGERRKRTLLRANQPGQPSMAVICTTTAHGDGGGATPSRQA
jgi:hypothetical protein